MAKALETHGHTLSHVIGPQTAHKYDPESLTEIKDWLQQELRKAGAPQTSWHWQTPTLRYPGMGPWRLTGLAEHFKDSRLDAYQSDDGTLRVETRNVTGFQHFGEAAFQAIEIDGQQLEAGQPAQFRRSAANPARWERGTLPGLRKRPGLQGPIDDAFLEPFRVLTPSRETESGRRLTPELKAWLAFERDHFQERWEALFRGRFPEQRQSEPTQENLSGRHLVIFGTPWTDPRLQEILTKTPVGWTQESIEIGERRWDARHHVLLMIYPHPGQPERYVVINSGPTFREGHDRTNSLQNPKLGDWAVVDIR